MTALLKNHKIFIANDHADIELKNKIIQHLELLGARVLNLGSNISESVDYPDYANKLALEIKEATGNTSNNIFGILICGTGIGISIAANRHPWVRAVVAESPTEIGLEKLSLSRRHNNANVLCLGARFMSFEDAKKSLDVFLKTEFEGDTPEGARHKKRVQKLS